MFLLLAVMLGGLAPLQTAVGIGSSLRTAPTEPNKAPVEHHREHEKLRERRQHKTIPNRRAQEALDGPKRPLPESLQATRAAFLGHPRPPDFVHRAHDSVRVRHSPAALQVYRH